MNEEKQSADLQRSDSQMRRSRALIEHLRVPEAYPHATEAIRVLETHCAWVVLTGEYAYKIKKPVNFGFLDFSTLEKRRFICQEEVRLNRRFAPELYLDVVAIRGQAQQPRIGGTGPVLEYAVRMRQFPDNGLLSQLAELRQLQDEHIEQLIKQVADFHQGAVRAGAEVPYGEAHRVHHWLMENFAHIEPLVDQREDRVRLERLRSWSERERASIDALLKHRKEHGFIRECHGDLHLGNLTLIRGRVTLFDCIEFNPELRWIDVCSEAAFLFMDLDERGYRNYAFRFLNGYLQQTGDYEGMGVFRYYLVYRALVRAKVAMLRRAQAQPSSQAYLDAGVQFGQYLQLAERYTAPLKATLFITYGVSGSGKSTLARQLCEAQGMIQIRSDVERKRIAGLMALDGSHSEISSGLYSADLTERTYKRLADLAAVVLAAHYTVIVDATFLKRKFRDRLRQTAQAQGVAFLILHCYAGEPELRRRIQRREVTGMDASEANLAVLETQLGEQHVLEPDEIAWSIQVDTDQADYLKEALAGIRSLKGRTYR